MSNLNHDSNYDQLSTVIRFSQDQFAKELNIALPGNIITYDAETKRALVQPSINVLFTDRSEQRRPPIVDVPFVWPSTGGYIVHAPVRKNDPVMLIISQRGITRFKETYRISSCADDPGVMSMRDAIAIPGFGGLEIEVPQPDALTAQTEDGRQYISVNKNGNIRVISTAKIYMEAPNIELRAGDSRMTMDNADTLISAPHIGLND